MKGFYKAFSRSILTLLLATSLIIWGTAHAAMPGCKPINEAFYEVLAFKKQAYAATLVSKHGIVINIYLSMSNGWTILWIPSEDEACLILEGDDIYPAINASA